MTAKRLNYEDSLKRLQELGVLSERERPPLRESFPTPDDEEPLGLGFYKTKVRDVDLGDLTIPRTFFGRSEISGVSFRNSDLSESNLRWNDFIDVDFTDAALVRADFRASIYTRVNFTRADLRGADMRRANYEECVFDGAIMKGAALTRHLESRLALSSEQKAVIVWCNADGPEPSGG